MFGFFETYPKRFDVSDEFSLRWDIIAAATRLKTCLNVEKLNFNVATLTVSVKYTAKRYKNPSACFGSMNH